MKFLEESLIAFNVDVSTPEEAIEAAGKLLFNNGTVEEGYIESMILGFREHGPYIVLAPGVALPHARPEHGVKEASVSMVQLTKPIHFGHPTNDPVKLVFGLGASSNEQHLLILQKLIALLSSDENIELLSKANNYNHIQKLIELLK